MVAMQGFLGPLSLDFVTTVMHVKFTYTFALVRNFEILILLIQEEIAQSQPLKSAIPISLLFVLTLETGSDLIRSLYF